MESYFHDKRVSAVFANWINPKSGDLLLPAIRGHRVLDCVEAIKAGGAPTVASDSLRYIRQVLDCSVAGRLLPHNPAGAISLRQIGFIVPA